MIADIAQEELNKLSSQRTHSLTKQQFDEMTKCLQAVLSTVQNSRNINNFMMMTINRCIDYTKASKGLKLVPKYETIDLVETLSLPFKCMRDVSQSVHVRLEPLSKDVCSHVITDKQWLQENILCLLSNAVKYSAGGCVNGRISLTTAGAVGLGSCVGMVTGDPSSSLASWTAGSSSSKPEDCSTILKKYRKVTVRSLDHLDADDGVKEAQERKVLLIEVDDTGIGMTDEAMLSLFNAFKQAQSLAGGTGLGLFSLTRRIEALGGVYGVKKRADGIQGSLFWFTIPYRPDDQFARLMREHSQEQLTIKLGHVSDFTEGKNAAMLDRNLQSRLRLCLCGLIYDLGLTSHIWLSRIKLTFSSQIWGVKPRL
jgi:signal transduction histidine kinase